MKLSPQKQKLFDLFSDGAWHCSNEITPLFIRDYRKRISEMNREGFTIGSLPCSLPCAVRHDAGVHMYRLTEAPKEPPKRVMYVRHPLTGERITTEQLAAL